MRARTNCCWFGVQSCQVKQLKCIRFVWTRLSLPFITSLLTLPKHTLIRQNQRRVHYLTAKYLLRIWYVNTEQYANNVNLCSYFCISRSVGKINSVYIYVSFTAYLLPTAYVVSSFIHWQTIHVVTINFADNNQKAALTEILNFNFFLEIRTV